MKIIELCNLTKKYKNPVLKNISYCFLKGKTYLVTGENGSGKTTLIKLILGLINPSKGYIKKDYFSVSYVPDNLSFPEFLSINSFLYNLGLIYKIDKLYLKEKMNKQLDIWMLDGNYKLNELSKGMRQKVLLVQAMLHDGNIYIFDEPLNGLDKDMQQLYFKQIKHLKTKNKTIIIITHQKDKFMKEVDFVLKIENGFLNEELN